MITFVCFSKKKELKKWEKEQHLIAYPLNIEDLGCRISIGIYLDT
jgi:hypothetical protein